MIQYSDVFIEPDGSLGRTEQKIDKMLREDVIEPSNSPWAAPIVLVKKRERNDSVLCGLPQVKLCYEGRISVTTD